MGAREKSEKSSGRVEALKELQEESGCRSREVYSARKNRQRVVTRRSKDINCFNDRVRWEGIHLHKKKPGGEKPEGLVGWTNCFLVRPPYTKKTIAEKDQSARKRTGQKDKTQYGLTTHHLAPVGLSHWKGRHTHREPEKGVLKKVRGQPQGVSKKKFSQKFLP